MPTYEYVCENGHHVEAYQRFEDAPLTTCSQCGASLRKVFHPANVVFKGSGFYATDNRKSGKKVDDAKPSTSAGGEATKDAKKDTKAGTKNDASSPKAPAAKEKSA